MAGLIAGIAMQTAMPMDRVSLRPNPRLLIVSS
jgi:hypothetical protein